MQYVRTFKIGKLYYKYIKDTYLERQGWTSKRLSELLLQKGFIRLVTKQKQSTTGRWEHGELFYIELEGKSIGRKEFFKLFKEDLKRSKK